MGISVLDRLRGKGTLYAELVPDDASQPLSLNDRDPRN